MATVQIIKATKTHEAILQNKTRKLRAAAYARVSTEKEQQEYSYETQCRYYTELIQSNPNYEFVEMYADEGLTGTMLKKRDGFLRMIDDAMNGKIDVIYIKSISRFARNTVDCLTVCRNLKSRNVNIFFEKENRRVLRLSEKIILRMIFAHSHTIRFGCADNYIHVIIGLPAGQTADADCGSTTTFTVVAYTKMFRNQ